MIIKNLPLYIGASLSAHNPENIPDTFPFEAYYDASSGFIRQRLNESLSKILDDVYSKGLLIGTPLSESEIAVPYADDFLNFINQVTPSGEKLKILEVGAGTGYLSRRLMDLGHEVTPIEPGKGYSAYWKKYGVNVINDFFPSPSCRGPYDLIISYLVLEHIPDPLSFIVQMKGFLSDNGAIIFSVPDESAEIEAGDPSMLVHEHFNYFDSTGLDCLLSSANLASTIKPSSYGRCLYSVSRKTSEMIKRTQASQDVVSYLDRSVEYVKQFRKKIRSLLADGSVGVFCPGRALALLELGMEVRMFDDDPYLINMFYPPFTSKIENRSALLEKPVDHLIIMSRTFGNVIKQSLIHDGYEKNIIVASELI